MAVTFRRAVLDDLPALQDLWLAAGLSGLHLEAKFAEFQVAEEAGQLNAAVAVSIQDRDALLHHACFRESLCQQQLEAPLWQRILQVAANHGTCRIWTTDPIFPKDDLFVPPDSSLEKRRPEGFSSEGSWRVRILKEEVEQLIPAEDQLFELFQQSEIQRREQMLRTAKILKILATLFLLFVILMGILFGASVFKKHRKVLDSKGPPAVVQPSTPGQE